MRLGVIIPIPNLDSAGLRKREDAYSQFAPKSTEVMVAGTEGGPESTDSRYEEVLAGPHIITSAKKLDTKHLSALIVSCFGDPSVGALREIFDFPVVGPGEASILTASQLGDLFSIVTILPNGVAMIRERVQQIGFSERLASVRSIDLKPNELDQQTVRTESALLEQGRIAVENDDASVLIIGCTNPQIAMTADKLSTALGVPVVNPIAAAVNTAESLVAQNLKNSRRSYVKPLSRP
jgi:allantoin racemase